MLTDDSWLGRRELARELTRAGYKTAEATLATKATRGGGPPYRLFGRKPVYRWEDALAWARSRTSRVIHSTSELAAEERTRIAKGRQEQATDAPELPQEGNRNTLLVLQTK